MNAPRELGPEPEPRSELERELVALYRTLQPPPLAEDAGEADPTTREVVEWMRGAWQTLEVPPASLPHTLRPLARLRARRRRIAWAAAAGFLLLAGGALWRGLGSEPHSPATPRVAQAPRAPSAPAATDRAAVEILGVRSDRIELRSGSLRLVLIDPSPFEPPSEM